MPELTNQDIANMAGLSINTVNHCLSDRSKSSGRLYHRAAVQCPTFPLISAFGIEPDEKRFPGEENSVSEVRRFRKVRWA